MQPGVSVPAKWTGLPQMCDTAASAAALAQWASMILPTASPMA